MPGPKKVRCEGRAFDSIKALAQHYGKHHVPVAKRLRDGWSPEEAVGAVKRKRAGHGKRVVVEGIEYRTLKAACTFYGLAYPTIQARLARGYSVDDAFAGRFRDRAPSVRAKPVRYKGTNYASISEAAAAYGQRPSNVIRRVTRGWTFAQALLDAPPPPRFRNFDGHARSHHWKAVRTSVEGDVEPVPDVGGYKLYVVTNRKNGKQYVGITKGDLEERLKGHFGSARRGRKSAFFNAIRKHGEAAFSIALIRSDAKSLIELQRQEVEEIEVRNCIKNGYNTAAGGSVGTSKSISVAGVLFASRAAAAEFYGVPVAVFNTRLGLLGWSAEEAAGLVSKTWPGKAKRVVVGGVEYESVRQAAVAHGRDFRKVYDRFGEKGWSLEQALDLEAPPNTVKFRGYRLLYKGKMFKSLSDLARKFGVDPQTISNRTRKGVPLAEAVRRAIDSKRKMSELALRNGSRKPVVVSRAIRPTRERGAVGGSN